MSDTVAYYNIELITTVKSFMVQGSRATVNGFHHQFTIVNYERKKIDYEALTALL